ncbi:MAG TPA: LacI family DNA-binding transcriptional regulator [Candidatus Faecalibacterium intestinipullorum]|nr:LacI family DNA-binding transcriptional regulator [Candidatus Faecalibacterium intestinipullorum]
MNISEIAKLAGVSKAAVSRYLNDGYLSEEKKQAIAKVIAETGYRPMIQAQSLRTRKTRIIGVVLPKINSFSISTILAGIESVLEKQGFQILLADSHNDPERELESLRLFAHQRVDGVILIATVLTAAHRALLRRMGPVVVLGQRLRGVNCVYHDDYNAFYEMTKLVLAKGCRRLGYIGALPKDVAVGAERSRAWADALTAAGMADQAGNTVVAEFSIASGREKARELWEKFGPLDAVICATDSMAVGALQYLRSQGVRVPGQTLLTGQGASNISEATTPTITTIRYFYEESGTSAARLLLEQLETPDLPAKEIKLGYTLVEQDSTRR